MAFSVCCPSCGANLRLRDELAGRRVKCPKCREVITVSNQQAPSAEEEDENRRPRKLDRTNRDQDLDDEDLPRRKKKKKKQQSRNGLIYALAGGGVALVIAIVVLVLILTRGGDGKGNASAPPPGPGPAKTPDKVGGQPAAKELTFLDERKTVGPKLEWNREVKSQTGGAFTFRIISQGPFSVTIVTERGYRALQSGNQAAFKKEDMLLTFDSKQPQVERSITVPPGSSWFIIENQLDRSAEIHLQCFTPKTQ